MLSGEICANDAQHVGNKGPLRKIKSDSAEKSIKETMKE